MKRFLDSSVLVESCLSQSPSFAAADALVNASDTCTSAHALAEAYATLSGDVRLRIAPADAAHMVEDLAKALSIETLPAAAYQPLISARASKRNPWRNDLRCPARPNSQKFRLQGNPYVEHLAFQTCSARPYDRRGVNKSFWKGQSVHNTNRQERQITDCCRTLIRLQMGRLPR